jgi:HlyD family secretion protein
MTDASIAEFLGENPAPVRRRWRKWGMIALGLIALAALAYALFGGRAAPKYATIAVQRGDLAVTVSATGNLAPTKQVNVGSEESGIVVNVYVQNNDHVKKGQPLAQLDPALFRAALMQNEAQLRSAQATVAQNQATLDQTTVTLRRYQDVARLSGGKVPSQTELDTARGDHARALANLQAAIAQVAQARATLSTSRTNLAKATIYAPVDGVVLSRQVEPGQTVAAAFNVATLFTIAEDLTAMRLDVKVDEADIGEVAVGNSATFAVDAYPGKTFSGAVTRIDLGANATPTINSAGTTTTSTTSTVVAYTAILAVKNPELLLRPGMTATATILAKMEHDQLLVPNAALRFAPDSENAGGGGVQIGPKSGSGGFGVAGQTKTATIGRGSHQTVFVLAKDGALRRIGVIVGSTNGALTAVYAADLKPGMTVVTGRLSATGA